MNSVFSLKRFGMLFKKHTVENLKSYGMMLVVFFGILTVSTLLSNYHSPAPHQIQPYMIYLVAAGTIFTSNIFINLGDKRRTIASLTLPATSFEKFLVGWVYSYLIFLIVYTALYYALMIAVLHFGTWPKDVVLMNIFDAKEKTYYIYAVYTVLHAIVLLGAITFKKMHFIKTAFAVFSIGAVIWLLNDQVVQFMLGRKVSGNPPFAGASFLDTNHEYYNVDLSYNYLNLLIALFLGLSVIIWVSAYFKLKEKQV